MEKRKRAGMERQISGMDTKRAAAGMERAGAAGKQIPTLMHDPRMTLVKIGARMTMVKIGANRMKTKACGSGMKTIGIGMTAWIGDWVGCWV